MSVLMLTEELAEKVDTFFESKKAHRYIISLVIINALVMGLSFVSTFKAQYSNVLSIIDNVILSIFIIELAARIITTRERFFKNYWNVFDLLITLVSLLPSYYNLSALRLLRVLHSLRLLELFPRTKHILDGLAHSLIGILNVMMLAFVFYYVFSLIATGLFGTVVPQSFGSLEISMFTLFKFMTNPNWDLVNTIVSFMPYGFAFFILFVLCISYFIMNLVVGVVVGAMTKAEEENESSPQPTRLEKSVATLEGQLSHLQQDVSLLRQQLMNK